MYFTYKHCRKDYISANDIRKAMTDERINNIIKDIELKLWINNHNLDLKERDYVEWATERNHLYNDLDLFQRALKVKGKTK